MVTRDSSGKVTVRLTGSLRGGREAARDERQRRRSGGLRGARARRRAARSRRHGARRRERLADGHRAPALRATAIRRASPSTCRCRLAEEIKVILKVSQNLHASTMPYIVGALVGKTTGRGALQAGFDAEHDFLTKAGLDLMTAAQGDGAGGAPGAFFSPAFMVQYLAYMATRPDTAVFRKALPILGRDGTLWNIQPQSPAAGKVFAKTGTFCARSIRSTADRSSRAKGLAGYMTTSSGRRLAFAIYGNRIPFPPNYQGDAALLVGQALGEIAVAMWSDPLQP